MKYGTRKLLTEWTTAFAETADGDWLNDFDWHEIPVEWSARCNADSGIMGMYSFGHIWLMECENAPECIWPTYIHELYHRWQSVEHPVRFLIGKLYRPLIEDPADRITEVAEDWIRANNG